MANKLIQWNCRGLRANFNELLLLLTGLCPSIICLQETFLKPTDNFTALLCGQTVPEAILNQVAIKLLKSGLLT